MHTYIHACVQAYIHAACMHACTSMHTSMHTCMHACTAYIHTFEPSSHMYIHMYIYTHIFSEGNAKKNQPVPTCTMDRRDTGDLCNRQHHKLSSQPQMIPGRVQAKKRLAEKAWKLPRITISTDTRKEDQQIAGRSSNCCSKGSSCLKDEQTLPGLLKGTQSEMNGSWRMKENWNNRMMLQATVSGHILEALEQGEAHTLRTTAGWSSLSSAAQIWKQEHGDRHETKDKRVYQFLSHCPRDCGTRGRLLFVQSCQQCVECVGN